ncbi:hypothetical protein PGT21_028048 [Puccinia graminis f. sp. tritici]|uniref:Uncharacterized protein n=1 Tax=Puccinia graminis f. sp. tritici TaxID=56615 RepID=A0A5B0QBM6_PUCGR|nr:hypothetical protein PGT21_028048 [Puccinia graminis f. sp. tritici]
MQSTGRRRRDSTKHIWYAHASSLQAIVLESRGSRGFRVVLALATQTTSHPALLLRAEVRFGTCGNRVYPNFHRHKWHTPRSDWHPPASTTPWLKRPFEPSISTPIR